MNRFQRLPRALMANRRCEVLAGHVADLVPTDASVLDVGCGDGALTRCLGERRPDLRVEGIEVFVRPDAEILVREYDGVRIPHSDDA
ncbi:MAG: SAM-dependent methyltransferase, partial [Proteobacteria bacterium]|nr:SAM-dependent methyltransferase [Pseudomonadota bacterium]